MGYPCPIATFYNFFPTKVDWAVAVLDSRVNEALDQQAADEPELAQAPRERVLGHLVLLGDVATSLPGITRALVEKRTDAQAPYTELLPRYYGEVTHLLQEGQEEHSFQTDIRADQMADFAIDSLAMTYAVHLDNQARGTAALPSLLLDGLTAKG